MSRLDVAIVGGGLFGQVIAKELRHRGREVTVFDAQYENAGSRPAACLIKPSWLSSVPRAEFLESLALLDRHYGVRDIQFKTGIKDATVHWVDPRKVLEPPTRNERICCVRKNLLVTNRPEEYECSHIIVAAGYWSSALVHVPGLRGYMGAAFTWWTAPWAQNTMQPFIRPWAPYKQLVGFMRAPDELWCGDGSSILEHNWNDRRELQSRQRCMEAVGETNLPVTLRGIRPYVQGTGVAYCVRNDDGIWVATGGAKNGTLAAAWCAGRIARELT